MAKQAAVIERSGNTVTVVAPTAEEAMAVVGDAAPGFRTTSIGKVRRGGLAGFFATEMVRVVAEAPGTDGPTCLDTAVAAPPAPRSRGTMQLATADDLIASLCSADGPFAGHAKGPFAHRLAAELHRTRREPPAPGPITVPSPAPAELRRSEPDRSAPSAKGPQRHESAAATATAATAELGLAELRRSEPDRSAPSAESPQRQQSAAADTDLGLAELRGSEPDRSAPSAESPQRHESAGVWSAAALEAVGLPARLVASVAAIGPQDEVTWNAALMLALRDRCGAPLPTGDVLAGPAAGPVAAGRHVPVVAAADLVDREGGVAVLDADANALARSLGERSLHLVVGGEWRPLATAHPAVVSAATTDDLIDAVRVAASWDVPLGWVHDGTGVGRIDPFLVAAHVRALLAADRPAAPRAARSTPRSRARPTATRPSREVEAR